MEERIITFTADEQGLVKTGGISHYASDTISYIKAVFTLGENWQGFDEVRAVFKSPYECKNAVLDSNGECYVPVEVLFYKGKVRVNLVGSIVTETEITDRLTTYSIEALEIDEDVPICGNESQPISPSEYEQFVAKVANDANRAEQSATDAKTYADEAEASAQNASESASASAVSASDSARSATASSEYAQNASESAQSAENAKDDAEDARDKILGMRATAETLEAGSDATASYSDGLLTLGIPRGDQGIQGIQGETGATPNLTIGTVETLAPTEDATATITGTAENPVLNLGIPKGEQGDVNLSQLEALLPTDTASGSIVTITDGQSVVPAKSLKVVLEPIQDLHGYDKPWSAGAGKNKLPVSCESVVKNGVTYTVYKNGAGAVTRIHAEGTSTSAHAFSVVEGHSASNPFTLKAGSYWFKALSNGVGGSFDFNLRKKGESTDIVQTTNKVALTLTEDTEFQSCYLYMYNGKTINADIYPMIWLQSESNDDFEPYSNICPISGHTECVSNVSGVNVWDEEWEAGAIVNGQPVSSASSIRSKNFIACVPSSKVFVVSPRSVILWWYNSSEEYIGVYTSIGQQETTVPSTARFFKIGVPSAYGTTYNHDISINYPSTDHEYHAYNGTSYTTTLGQTVYGGTLDVVSGVLTVDKAMVDLGSVDWAKVTSGRTFFYTNLSDGAETDNVDCICSNYEVTSSALAFQGGDKISRGYGSVQYAFSRFAIKDSDYNSLTEAQFKTAMSGVQLCYELATPQTYQLTPQEVQLLLGTNNIWSDGEVTLTYNADIQRYIEKKLQS